MRTGGHADINPCTHSYAHYGGSSVDSDSYPHGHDRTGNAHAYAYRHQGGRSPNGDSHLHASTDSEPYSNPCGGPRS